FGNHAADVVLHRVAMFLANIVAAGDRADLIPRNPGALAHVPARQLHLLSDHGAGAIMRPAWARVEFPCPGQPAATGYPWAGGEGGLGLAVASFHANLLGRVNGLASMCLDDFFARFQHGAVSHARHIDAVLLVLGAIGRPANRNLIVFDLVVANGVTAFA